MSLYSRVVGTGSHLPERRLSNADLVTQLAQTGVETSDEWIVERTGIRARHFAADGQFSSDLALEACRQALNMAGLGPEDIDLLVVATSTPDMVFPSTACILQHKLAQLSPKAQAIAGAPAFDVQAVCAGFIYALSVADAMIRAGNARRALVVGAAVLGLPVVTVVGERVVGAAVVGAAVIGAAVGVVLPEWLRFAQAWYLFVFGIMVVVMMIVLPDGLLSLPDQLKAKRRAREASAARAAQNQQGVSP